MTEIRKLGFSTQTLDFYVRNDRSRSGIAPNPTPAEVADLLARVLEAAGHEPPTYPPESSVHEADAAMREMAVWLARWRAALELDAAKAAGREIAAIVFVDELPEAEPKPDEADVDGNIPVDIDGTRLWFGSGGPKHYLRLARIWIAAARHLESRDAAKAAEDREIEALAAQIRFHLAVDVEQSRVVDLYRDGVRPRADLGARPAHGGSLRGGNEHGAQLSAHPNGGAAS